MSHHMKLGTKISIGFGIVLVLLLVAAATGVNGLSRIVREMTDAIDTGNLTITMYESRQQEKNFIIRGDDSYKMAVFAQSDLLKKEIDKIRVRSTAPPILGQLDDVATMAEKYRQAFKTYVDLENDVKKNEYRHGGICTADGSRCQCHS